MKFSDAVRLFAPVTHPLVKRRAFSLIEAVIVLGVVAIVMGGIWWAARTTQSNLRLNEAALGIVYIAESARRILPVYSYHSNYMQNVNITGTLASAGAVPKNFRSFSSALQTPMGSSLVIVQGCWSQCPMLGIQLRGPGSTWRPGLLSAAECITLARRVAALSKDNKSFLYIQIQTSDNPDYQYLYPPIDPISVDCPADFASLNFWFEP